MLASLATGDEQLCYWWRKSEKASKKERKARKKEREEEEQVQKLWENSLSRPGKGLGWLTKVSYTVMTRTLCWTLAAVTQKERPLSLLWSSGQQHALLFVFQMPLWVRPLVYAQSAYYNFPFTVGLWNSQRNVKLPSYDFVQFQISNHHLATVGKWILNTFLFPVISQSLRPV